MGFGSVVEGPLTPTLSLRERGFKLPLPGGEGFKLPLPLGEGRGEGTIHHKSHPQPPLDKPYFFCTNANQRSSAFTPSWEAHHLADNSACREIFSGDEGSLAVRSAGITPALKASGFSGP